MKYKFFKRPSFYFMLLFYFVALAYLVHKAEQIIPVTYNIACVSIVITGVIKLSFLNKDTYDRSEYLLDLIEGIVDLIVGVITFNFGLDYYLISLICGICFFIPPTIRLIIAPKTLNQLLIDSPKALAGIIIITSNPNTFVGEKIVIGCIFLILGTIILGFKIYHYIQYKKELRNGDYD
jgi:hypothetical protein